jgi:hypothetical protein
LHRLNDGLECKYVINGVMSESESDLSFSSKVSPLKLSRELLMEDRSIELREHVANNDHSAIVKIFDSTQFVNRMNCVK